MIEGTPSVTREQRHASKEWMSPLGKGAARAAVVRLAFAASLGSLAGCPASPGMLPLLDEIATPLQPTATPGDGRIVLAWSSVEGATSYSIYYSDTAAVTKADAKVTAAASPTVIEGLTNGSVYYLAVSAVTPAGEGPLSTIACAMPTSASTAGLTLYDPLCGPALDGSRWGRPGATSIGVSGGGAVLSVDVPHQAPTSEGALHYWAGAPVKTAAGQRVTTLTSDMRVPAGSASATGGAKARGIVRLRYQPPAASSGPPQQDALRFEVGLVQTAERFMAFRSVAYCAAAGACTILSAAGIAFVDPPGFARLDETTASAPASYDTTYTVTVALDEAAGVFHWTIAGGAFGTGVSGSADPAAYLASAPAWSGVPLAGEAFQVAQIWAETLDPSAEGGGSGKIAMRFDNVRVGFDGAAAAPWDDFSGTGDNSGPFDLSANKWRSPGSRSALPTDGSLAIHVALTSAGSYASTSHEISVRDPASMNVLQADMSIPAFSPGTDGDVQVALEGTFYNDGTPDDTPSSRLGDIRAKLVLFPESTLAAYWVDRCPDATCSGLQTLIGGSFAGVSGGTPLHTVRLGWDPALERITFGVDGNTVEVDPTVHAPVAAPPRYPIKWIVARAATFSPSSPAGTRATIAVKVNNVFVSP